MFKIFSVTKIVLCILFIALTVCNDTLQQYLILKKNYKFAGIITIVIIIFDFLYI